jgi:hypothetical protein
MRNAALFATAHPHGARNDPTTGLAVSYVNNIRSRTYRLCSFLFDFMTACQKLTVDPTTTLVRVVEFVKEKEGLK